MRSVMVMKRVKACFSCIMLVAFLPCLAGAMPLSSSARTSIPGDLQQLISVDYRALKDSPTAMQLKQQVLPDNLKQFESALKGIGIDPSKDVDTLAFASFRTPKQGIKGVGVAYLEFAKEAALKKLQTQGIKPTKYSSSLIYPMDGGIVWSFLDVDEVLFAILLALKIARDTRDGLG